MEIVRFEISQLKKLEVLKFRWNPLPQSSLPVAILQPKREDRCEFGDPNAKKPPSPDSRFFTFGIA